MRKRLFNRQISIDLALTGSLVLLVMVAAGTVFSLVFFTGVNSTVRLMKDNVRLIIEAAAERTRQQLEPARQQVEFLASLAAAGQLDVTDREAMDLSMRASLAAAGQIESIVWVTPDLQGRIFACLADGSVITLDRDWREHPVIRHSIGQALRAESSYWGEIAHVPDMPDGSERSS